MVHGDSNGLVIPPEIAPVQVSVRGDAGLADKLKRANVRAENNFRDPVLKGVPLVARQRGKYVALQRRDTLETTNAARSEIVSAVSSLLGEIQDAMFRRSMEIKKKVVRTSEYGDFSGRGFFDSWWCGETACAKKIKEETGNSLRLVNEAVTGERCVRCGKKAAFRALFAAAY
jgi:prolyl-tRNA synthetase